jgi:RNA polymerase sigma-70 factor (ECF subfamily)
MKVSWSEAEFEGIFRAHYAPVYRVVRRILRSNAEADEVCSEAFWRLWRQKGGAEMVADGAVGGWLYRTATRAAIDAIRSRRRRETEELAEYEDGGSAAPLDSLLREERIAAVRRVLAKLKIEKAQILLLRHSGLSYQEIGAAMRMNVNSVGKMLVRSEAEFCRLYEQQQEMEQREVRFRAVKEGR